MADAKLVELLKKGFPPPVGPCAVCGRTVDSHGEEILYGGQAYSVTATNVELVHWRCARPSHLVVRPGDI